MERAKASLRPVIGLEIHVQLSNAGTKLFCDCDSEYRSYKANTNVCPVCLGLPGALPVPGRAPIVLALAASLGMGCRMPEYLVFTRKHYFYPDLPKNYQITQFEKAGGAPVCLGGKLEYFNTDEWRWESIGIRRINLEEDPGRTYYEGDILRSRYAYVDYNRSGVPLLEIVTEPEIKSPRQARMVVDYLLLMLEYIGATNPRLEGVFRVDANISLPGGERVEIKNIGSTLDVEKALRFEYTRQKTILERGGRVDRETRHWDSARGSTKPLRLKEEEADYLYFPDPDLPPVRVSSDLLSEAKLLAENSPRRIYDEILQHRVRKEIAWSIVSTPVASRIYLKAVNMGGDPQIVSRLVGVDLKGEIKELGRDVFSPESWPRPETITRLAELVSKGEYTYDTIKGLVLPKLAAKPRASLDSLLPEKAVNIETLVDEVLAREAKAVEDYLSGKSKALNYLVGQVIRATKGKAVDPRLVRELVVRKLKTLKSRESW